jgi:hypothetical protein
MAFLRLLPLAAILALPACDKALHFGAGAGIAAVVYDATGSKGLGCAAATVAGIGKEMIDPIPDPFDIAATVAGGCGLVAVIE